MLNCLVSLVSDKIPCTCSSKLYADLPGYIACESPPAHYLQPYLHPQQGQTWCCRPKTVFPNTMISSLMFNTPGMSWSCLLPCEAKQSLAKWFVRLSKLMALVAFGCARSLPMKPGGPTVLTLVWVWER